MIISKSFGYALRGIVYVSAMSTQGKKTVHADEIATSLNIPKHFLGKIMNKLVKAGILDSSKGQNGGFAINQHTLTTPLLRIIEITSSDNLTSDCALGLKQCNARNPCPLHDKMEFLRDHFYDVFINKTIDSLLIEDREKLINSLAAIPG